jgi:hypothetical protein
MNSAAADIATYREAARLNREDPLREGQLLRFPDYGQCVMTGDLHGHERNFARLKKYADLDHMPARHVMLHEMIHAEPHHAAGEDMSHQTMLEAARWKTQFPDQIHFLQSNHELSQWTGKDIFKNGRIVTNDFVRGMAITYGSAATEVLAALTEFIASFPIAARTANRIFLSHSLPNHRDLEDFDTGVIHRELTEKDLSEDGSVYKLVWGRHHTMGLLETLGEAFDVDYFICGHQPQESGFDLLHDRLIIIASDHNHGVFLPFDLRKTYEASDLIKLIRPFAAIA